MSIPEGHFDVLKVQIASFRESLGSQSPKEDRRQFNELSLEFGRLEKQLGLSPKDKPLFNRSAEVQGIWREFRELKEAIATGQTFTKSRRQPFTITEVDKGLALTGAGALVLSYGLPAAYASVAWPVSLTALGLLGVKKVYDSCCGRPAKVKVESTVSGSTAVSPSHPSLRYRGSDRKGSDVDYKGMSRSELEALSRRREMQLMGQHYSVLESYEAAHNQFNVFADREVGNAACTVISTLGLARRFRGELTGAEELDGVVREGAILYEHILRILQNHPDYADWGVGIDTHLSMDAVWGILTRFSFGVGDHLGTEYDLREYRWIVEALDPATNFGGHLDVARAQLRGGEEEDQYAACIESLNCPNGTSVGGILTVGRETYFVTVRKNGDGSSTTVDFMNSHGELTGGAANLRFTSVRNFAKFMANKRHAVPERDLKLLGSRSSQLKEVAQDINQYGILKVESR